MSVAKQDKSLNRKKKSAKNDALVEPDAKELKKRGKSKAKSTKKSAAKKPAPKKIKKEPKSKSGNSLVSGDDFEQIYAGRIRSKINNFMELHQNHNIANISLEILFVDIYSLLESEGLVKQDRFDKYAKPNMVEKTREIKIRHEKAGFFSRLLGLAPKIETEISQERYMAEGYSEFKQDIQNAIVFYHFSRTEHAEFNLDDIIKYTISDMFHKLDYKDYANDIRVDIESGKLKLLKEAQLILQKNRKQIEEGFEEVIVPSHDLDPPK